MVLRYPENGGCLPAKRKKKMCSNETLLYCSMLPKKLNLLNNYLHEVTK